MFYVHFVNCLFIKTPYLASVEKKLPNKRHIKLNNNEINDDTQA